MSLVVYRIVHPPVTRESGVRLPARETCLFSSFSRPPYYRDVQSLQVELISATGTRKYTSLCTSVPGSMYTKQVWCPVVGAAVPPTTS